MTIHTLSKLNTLLPKSQCTSCTCVFNHILSETHNKFLILYVQMILKEQNNKLITMYMQASWIFTPTEFELLRLTFSKYLFYKTTSCNMIRARLFCFGFFFFFWGFGGGGGTIIESLTIFWTDNTGFLTAHLKVRDPVPF